MQLIHFEVIGEPKPAGSKQSYPVLKRDGDPVRTATGRILTRTKHDNPTTPVWMQQVAATARLAYDGPLLTGALALTLKFERPRPKGHFGTGRNAGTLKASSPEFPTTRPDTVKLTRAVEDALTGVLWRDDSQIVTHVLFKLYGPCYRLDVKVGVKEPTL